MDLAWPNRAPRPMHREARAESTNIDAECDIPSSGACAGGALLLCTPLGLEVRPCAAIGLTCGLETETLLGCVAGGALEPPMTAADPGPCDDGDPCTQDSAGPLTGLCVHTPSDDGAHCDDGNPCTERDLCQAGVCAGLDAAPCDDGNPCTIDLCSPYAGCAHALASGPCDDGDPCTRGEVCAGGQCRATQQAPEVCNGADDDCDGVVDEHCLCARSAVLVSGSAALTTEGGPARPATGKLPRTWTLAASALAPGVWMSALTQDTATHAANPPGASASDESAATARRFSLPFQVPAAAQAVEAMLALSADERATVLLDDEPLARLAGDPSVPTTLTLDALRPGGHELAFLLETAPSAPRGGLLFELTVLWLEPPGANGCEADAP